MKNITLIICISFFTACTVIFSFWLFQRYRLPYNEQGNYFDGIAVLKYDSILVLAISAVGSLIAAVVLYMFYIKNKKNTN